MKAVRSTPPGVTVVDVDEPEGPGVLVDITSASVCASDLTYISYGSTQILGHELAGVTEDGRAVAIEAIFGCGECEHCVAGDRNLCHTVPMTALGVTIDGGMSEWYRAPASALVELPPGLALADASLVEPTAVAWHALRVAGVGEGSRVAVVGAGAIGLMAVAAALRMGAPEVGLVARHPHQIEAGERLGAAEASGLYDVVIEAAGSESAFVAAAEMTRPGGTMGALGVLPPDMSFPWHTWFIKELSIKASLGYGSHAGGRDFVDAANLLATHPELVATLVTHRFPIGDAAEAFRVAADKSTGALRVIVEP